MIKKRMLTGDRPTGPLHLGHYFGTLQNRVKFQEENFDTYIIVADYQVLTDRLTTDLLKQNIQEIIKDYIAIGLDPNKSTMFVQSALPQLSELTVLFSMLVSMARVTRNPTVKEEIKAMEMEDKISLGMFSYPISQAADILAFQANIVPVGEDQLPHIELTREIAKRFNSTFNEVLTIPEPLLGKSPRLQGLDGIQKMSKSRGNAIFLSDNDDLIRQKVMKAKTDSGSEIKYDPDERPYVSGLIDIFSLVSGISINDLEKNYIDKGYKTFKEELGEAIVTFLKPMKDRRDTVTNQDVDNILKTGNEKAQTVAADTLSKVKKAMKIDYYGF